MSFFMDVSKHHASLSFMGHTITTDIKFNLVGNLLIFSVGFFRHWIDCQGSL